MRRVDIYNDYDGFVEKFKPKKTTDDCYTPEGVYDVVLQWAMETFPDWRGRPVVRPFYPGGDYEHFDYPNDCVVIDNPPFSIYSSICRKLSEKGIQFLLFAPSLTASVRDCDLTYIVVSAQIVYENGAIVNTSFVTNHPSDYRFVAEPALKKALDDVCKKNALKNKKNIKKVKFHPNLTSIAKMCLFPANGIALSIRKDECCQIPGRYLSRKVFGGGYLLSEEARRKVEEERRKVEEARRKVEEERRKVEEERRKVEEERSILVTFTDEGELMLADLNNKR